MCNDGTDGDAMQRWNCVEAQHSMAMERNRAYLSTLSHSPFEFINNFVVVLFLIRLMNSTFLDTYCMRNISNYCRCLWTEQMYFFFHFENEKSFSLRQILFANFLLRVFASFSVAHIPILQKKMKIIFYSVYIRYNKKENVFPTI